MPHFTEEQLVELEKLFGIKRVEKTYPVRDGVVKIGDTLWWRCETGPEEFTLFENTSHFPNVVQYPDAYQIKKPSFTRQALVKYID